MLARSIAIKMKNFLFALARPLLYSYYERYFRKKLNETPVETQIFVLSRTDFGYFIIFLTYIAYWHKARGNTSLFLLTPHYEIAKKIARIVCPETKIVCHDGIVSKCVLKLFRPRPFLYQILVKVQGVLQMERQDILCFYATQASQTAMPKVSYSPYLDEQLQLHAQSVDPRFKQAYVRYRCQNHTDIKLHYDFIRLHNSIEPLGPTQSTMQALEMLKKRLGFEAPYAVLSLNAKAYDPLTGPMKKIQFPQRFNVLIDFLLEKGVAVVLQGREEQPLFTPRKKLIDYAHSDCCSIENDFALYAGALFSVNSKSGPEAMATTYDKPLLGINYAEIAHIMPNKRMRYFHRHIYSRDRQSILSWKTILRDPVYFKFGQIAFSDDEDIEFIEMTESEIDQSIREFYQLVLGEESGWLRYTQEQKEFKALTTPLHLDNHYIPSVPCQAFLASSHYV